MLKTPLTQHILGKTLRQLEFKSCTKLLAFPIVLITLGKECIQLVFFSAIDK